MSAHVESPRRTLSRALPERWPTADRRAVGGVPGDRLRRRARARRARASRWRRRSPTSGGARRCRRRTARRSPAAASGRRRARRDRRRRPRAAPARRRHGVHRRPHHPARAQHGGSSSSTDGCSCRARPARAHRSHGSAARRARERLARGRSSATTARPSSTPSTASSRCAGRSGEKTVRAGETARSPAARSRSRPSARSTTGPAAWPRPGAPAGAPRRAVGELWARPADGAGEPARRSRFARTPSRAAIEREVARDRGRHHLLQRRQRHRDRRLPHGDPARRDRVAVRGAARGRARGSAHRARRAQAAKRGPSRRVLEWAGDGWLRGHLPPIRAGESVA